jgi:ATP-dependent Clp protease ATP-binding subunit ClpA
MRLIFEACCGIGAETIKVTCHSNQATSRHMFERFTEKARRVIFFARYEASGFGAAYVEPEHLLLGLIREDKAISARFIGPCSELDSIRKQIADATGQRPRHSTSVDTPMSDASRAVLDQGENSVPACTESRHRAYLAWTART